MDCNSTAKICGIAELPAGGEVGPREVFKAHSDRHRDRIPCRRADARIEVNIDGDER